MLTLIRSLFLTGMLLIGTQVCSQTTKVGSATFDDSVQLGNKTLVLNGAGIRYKAIVRVYAAGLYLQKKADSPEDILGDNGPRRIQVAMFRDIEADELGKLFTRGMEKNASREDFMKALPGTIKMAEIFALKRMLKKGDTFSVDYVPGVGTTITVNSDAPSAPIKEPEFFNVLLKLWLGEYPADQSLKTALLGGKRRSSSATTNTSQE